MPVTNTQLVQGCTGCCGSGFCKRCIAMPFQLSLSFQGAYVGVDNCASCAIEFNPRILDTNGPSQCGDIRYFYFSQRPRCGGDFNSLYAFSNWYLQCLGAFHTPTPSQPCSPSGEWSLGVNLEPGANSPNGLRYALRTLPYNCFGENLWDIVMVNNNLWRCGYYPVARTIAYGAV